MNSDTTEPSNLISFKDAHCLRISEQIDEMEVRVREMEEALVHYANRMSVSISERLEELFPGDDLAEFSLPEGEGIIRLTSANHEDVCTDGFVSRNVAESIESTRRKIEKLQDSIEKIGIPR